MKFHYYIDENCGWLKVPYKIIKDINLQNKISGLSRREKTMVYLYKDKDMDTFLKRYHKRKGYIPTIIEHKSRVQSKIRSLPSYYN